MQESFVMLISGITILASGGVAAALITIFANWLSKRRQMTMELLDTEWKFYLNMYLSITD
jgi:hypothetical protein